QKPKLWEGSSALRLVPGRERFSVTSATRAGWSRAGEGARTSVNVWCTRIHVVDHPLVAHKLTTLRDQRADSPMFRRLADELVTLLAYEATRDVRTERVEITTPVCPATGVRLARP